MDKGFIFETKNRFYFIPTNNEKKSKKMAQNFVDFFASRFNGQITDEMLQNTFNTIYQNMYRATIRRSDDFTSYFIHTKYSRATISENDIIFITI